MLPNKSSSTSSATLHTSHLSRLGYSQHSLLQAEQTVLGHCFFLHIFYSCLGEKQTFIGPLLGHEKNLKPVARSQLCALSDTLFFQNKWKQGVHTTLAWRCMPSDRQWATRKRNWRERFFSSRARVKEDFFQQDRKRKKWWNLAEESEIYSPY